MVIMATLLSERFGDDVRGFVHALAFLVAADGVVDEEEVALAERAILRLNRGLSEADTATLAGFVRLRALDIVTKGYAASIDVTDKDQENYFLALFESMGAIAKAAAFRDEILATASEIINSDGKVTEEESRMRSCLETCLSEGPKAALLELVRASSVNA